MNFEIETSRTQKKDALEFAKDVFGDRLYKKSDSLFRNADRDGVIVYTGLDAYAPVCMHLINDPVIYETLSCYNGNVLIRDDLTAYTGEQALDLDDKTVERIQKIRALIKNSPGHLNENGELIIDLKGYHIGSHYAINLLLGDRSEYADCLQSTPKSVLDEFGRGSFRGKQEKQVLATRYVLSPDENGEPANRQFYLTENGKQIFYSLDIDHNVRSAYCCHSQNRTIITYETECGLRIIRSIFLLPQERNMPSAVEVRSEEHTSELQSRI